MNIKLVVNLPVASVDTVRDYAKVNGITMTEAIRRAFGLQHFLAKEISKGGKILIEDKSGRTRQLISA